MKNKMETYTPDQITQAMLYLGFDSDQICNLLNRLKEENGNPDEGTAVEDGINQQCYYGGHSMSYNAGNVEI